MATKSKKAPLRDNVAETDGTFRNPLYGGIYFNKKNDTEIVLDREQLAVLVKVTDHMTGEEFISQGELTKKEA